MKQKRVLDRKRLTLWRKNCNNMLLMLIDSSRAMDAKRNIFMGLTSVLIVDHY